MDEDEAPKLNYSAADAAAVAAKGPYPKGSPQSIYPIDPEGAESSAVAGSGSSSGGGGLPGAIPMDLADQSSPDWKHSSIVSSDQRYPWTKRSQQCDNNVIDASWKEQEEHSWNKKEDNSVINSSRKVVLTVTRHSRHFIKVYDLGLLFSFCFGSFRAG